MELAYEFTYTVTLNPPAEVGATPHGVRSVFEVTGGEATGERISGELVTPGADWALAGADGWISLDVRGQIRTGDGAVIYMQYFGHLEINEKVGAVLQGGDTPTDFSDQYFRTTPRLECGHPDYAWVNRTVFVAEGRALPGPAVEYRVYRVV
jgi:hypothetical protein